MLDETCSIRPSGVAVLELAGRLNRVTESQVRQRLSALVGAGHVRVVVDLSGVEFIDSAGLGVLITGLRTTRQAGGDLRISAPNPQAQLVFSLTGTERVLPAYRDADAAFG